MNKVVLMGRITAPLDLRKTQAGKSVLRFNIAVNRYSKDKEQRADFINCVAFEQTAEFITRYFDKGRMIAVEGNLKTGSFDDKNGVKHYTTEVNIEKAHFTGESKQSESQPLADTINLGIFEEYEELSDGENPF